MANPSGSPIAIGYRWQQRVSAVIADSSAALFPSGTTLRAQVRSVKNSPTVLATLTTENGGLARVDDNTFDIFMTSEQTALMAAGHVYLDLARTDIGPDYFYFMLKIEVLQPVTRPA